MRILAIIGIAAVWALGMISMRLDCESALATAAIRKDPPMPRAEHLPVFESDKQLKRLTMPLGCDMTIIPNEGRARCYVIGKKHGRVSH